MWWRKILIVATYHNQQVSLNKEWRLIDTAKALDLSVGTVAENVAIAKAIDEDETILTLLNRKEALKKVIYPNAAWLNNNGG